MGVKTIVILAFLVILVQGAENEDVQQHHHIIPLHFHPIRNMIKRIHQNGSNNGSNSTKVTEDHSRVKRQFTQRRNYPMPILGGGVYPGRRMSGGFGRRGSGGQGMRGRGMSGRGSFGGRGTGGRGGGRGGRG